jgi:hypothetical protein
MKQPRTSDFDPKSEERELKSSMAELPAIERPKQSLPADQVPEPGRVDRVGRVDRGALAALPKKRRIKPRHSLDLYEDQVEALQQLALEDRMRGGQGSMSAMAREALDDYIAKRTAG